VFKEMQAGLGLQCDVFGIMIIHSCVAGFIAGIRFVGMGDADSLPRSTPQSNALEWLPTELEDVDFTKRVSWGKYAPYNRDRCLPVTTVIPKGFAATSPALSFTVQGICGRARATTLYLKAQKGQAARPQPVPTPMFMPVGTKGCLKGVSFIELADELCCPIILANTYHLAIQPGTELIQQEPFGGLHGFQQSSRQATKATFNLLTDSNGLVGQIVRRDRGRRVV
jgi:Queuine tRNA-ribosyltransferase